MAVVIDKEVKKELNAGDAFGELALIYNSPRSATLKAIENTYLWGLNR